MYVYHPYRPRRGPSSLTHLSCERSMPRCTHGLGAPRHLRLHLLRLRLHPLPHPLQGRATAEPTGGGCQLQHTLKCGDPWTIWGIAPSQHLLGMGWRPVQVTAPHTDGGSALSLNTDPLLGDHTHLPPALPEVSFSNSDLSRGPCYKGTGF